MLTLIMCWIQDFIYITKNTPKKKHNKNKNSEKKTLKVKWNRRNTYLLNWWRFTRKLARDCRWKLWRIERKKIEIYRAVFPTDSPTDIKLIIILIYSIGEVSKIYW